MKKPVVIAAIDIGSNSIKLTVAQSDGRGAMVEEAWASETVRLGAGVEATGRLADDRVAAAFAVLQRFASEAGALGAERIIAVATDATRVAANGDAFLARLRNELGVEVRSISGDEEAALTFQGLAVSTDVSGHVVVADIGGGSTEFIVADEGRVRLARSLPLGSGRLTDRLVASDPPLATELSACTAAARAMMSEGLVGGLATGDGRRLLVVGGTGEYLARLVPDPLSISSASISEVLRRLQTLAASQLARTLDIAEARARVLPAGIAIVAAITDTTCPRRVDVARSGIRTGLLLAAFDELDQGKIASQATPVAGDPR